MKRLFFALALALFACSDPSPPPQAPAQPKIAPVAVDAAVVVPVAIDAKPGELGLALDPALSKRLDPVIDKATAEAIVGTVVMIAHDGKIVYRRAAGYADREAKRPMRDDTIFRFASMTKAIVSVAALALVDQGKLSLDDRVSKWLPEFRPKFEGREGAITVRHLITHKSGLSYKFIEKPDSAYHKAAVSDGLAEPGLAMADFLKRLGSVPLTYEPGTAWRYSLSVDVLGEVVARAGGGTLPAVVKQLVLDPIGMTDTAFAMTAGDRIAWPYAAEPKKAPVRMTEPYDRVRGGKRVRFSPGRLFDAKSFPSGGAGLAGTAGDYLRFAEALRTHRILKAETHLAMETDQTGKIDAGMTFGLGVGIIEDPTEAKSGRHKGAYGWAGIYGTEFWVDPDAKLTVVVLTNVAGQGLDNDIEKALYEVH